MATTKRGKKIALAASCTLLTLTVLLGALYRHELWSWCVSWQIFRQKFEGLGRNSQGFAEYQHRETGIVFVRLPGGVFDMGSPDTVRERETHDAPVHKVILTRFLISKYEVSQAEWKKIMGNNPSEFKGDSLPVEQVSWEDCQDFCRKSGGIVKSWVLRIRRRPSPS